MALKRANRHGLIAGATGTGKTVTLQVLAEAFAREGVNVFAADIKGDLSGVAVPGDPPPAWAAARATEIGVPLTPEAAAVRVLGCLRRARPSDPHHGHGDGPGADGARARSDRRAGRRADHRLPAGRRLDQGRARAEGLLLDLNDLRALLTYVSRTPRTSAKSTAWSRRQSIAALQRKCCSWKWTAPTASSANPRSSSKNC